uniref:Uncharacterized protein n=1 Tax=Oryza sativa subsp. japonica TaxID=39947 RepID=Q6K256_ORYSJ|nr:hypothetical protein [Oryza sativa Japonica Group]BAD26125.1 hypothetical protein [Oryza sativa Japonica Group]
MRYPLDPMWRMCFLSVAINRKGMGEAGRGSGGRGEKLTVLVVLPGSWRCASPSPGGRAEGGGSGEGSRRDTLRGEAAAILPWPRGEVREVEAYFALMLRCLLGFWILGPPGCMCPTILDQILFYDRTAVILLVLWLNHNAEN